jgi:hypothetical protein
VTSDIGVDLQITKIRFDGNIGFVREWRKSYPGESFMLSSNARLGHKADGNRIGREVLELAICKRQFTDAACAIAELDAMDREVLSSNRWSFEYARSVWNLAKALAPHKNPNERTTTMKKTKKTKTTGRKNKAVQKSIKDKLRATGASEKFLDKIHVMGFDDDDKKKSGPRPMGTKKPIATRKKGEAWPFDEDGTYLAGTPAGVVAGKKNMAANEKKFKERLKKAGKRLDKKTHKLVAGRKSACGKPMGVMEAGVFSGGVEGRDSWHFVDCKKCLDHMPEIIHRTLNSHGRWFCLMAEDDMDGDNPRWTRKAECGAKASPLESTTDGNGGGVNCPECLSIVAPSCRRHFVAKSGKQNSTLCGAKTTSANEYSTDTWWLCTCPDCYRVNEAPSVHPMQEDDVQLLLHNSMVAARNQGMKPTQEKCISCSDDSVRAKTKCLACAVLTKRGINTDDDWENKLSKLFNLPYEWVMDLLKGWDGDKAPELTYPTAFKLGKRLWRKHG